MRKTSKLHAVALDLVEHVGSLGDIHAVTAALDQVAIEQGSVRLHAIWRLPWRARDGGNRFRVDETIFFPAERREDAIEWLAGYKARFERQGGSVFAHFARLQNGPFRVTKALNTLQPLGTEHWPFDYGRKYGMRDGVCCPMRKWASLFYTPAVFEISDSDMAALHMASVAAAQRLSELTLAHGQREALVQLDAESVVLSPREHTVMQQVISGHRPAEIARSLEMKESTVRTHIRNARKKLGAATPPQAAVEAVLRNLIDY